MIDYATQFFGDDVKLEPIILQRSELQRIADCPHSANLYEKHAKEIDMPEILPETGILVHDLAKVAIESNEYNLQEAADYIDNELPKTRPDLQPEAVRAGKNLANELRRFGSNAVIACEQPFTRSLIPATDKQGEILIVSEPDLVLATTNAETILILDYKTGWKDRTTSEAYNDFQTCVNCWTVFGKEKAQTIHFFYLNTRIFTRSCARLERERDESNFQSRIFEAARLHLDKSDEAWPVAEKCGQCKVAKWCKLLNGELADFNKNPAKYTDSYIVLEARLKYMHDTISKSCKDGRVIYSSQGGRFDDQPRRKSPRRISYKSPEPVKNG